MSDYKDIFRSVESQNWFKCCLAVLITREGILEFVKNEIDTFQQDSLQKVYQVNNVPSGTNCLSCATHCVVPCRPNKSICQIRRGRCTFHTNPQNPCPNKICDNLRQEIEREHHFGAPSWKNTDSKGWCVNSWELAKCFMPPDGYSNISSVEATDFNGIISVMINCKRFENKLDDDLSKDVNLCTKARDVGRSVRHCADLKLSTTTMTQNISTLIDLLGDAKCLKTNAKASEAMTKLIKLKTDSFAISTVDVKAVLDALQTLSQTMGQQLQDLMEEMVKRNKRKMEQIETQHKKKMKLDGAAAISDLKTEIKDEVVAVKKDLETAGAAVMSNLKKEIKDEMGAVKKDLETALRQALAQHYLTRQSTMPLSPLMPEVDEKLNKFYMPFKMEIVDTKSTTTQVVDSYKSIFYDGDTSHTNIYIQGEAGIGKSTCCTKVALIWSESISKEIARNDCSINTSTVDPMQNEESIFSDEAIIHKFDFVFSLALRDFEGEWEIERMIEKFIVSELPDPQKYAGLVSTILDKKRCLIILDGLDEWSHQGKVCKNPGLIPHRKSWSNTTVLTLTRPWKMNEVRLRDSEISVLIQITGITDSEKFLRNVLNCLNDKYNTTHDLKGFLETIKVEKMEHFFEIPVLAMQVLWLWHSGYQLGDSKCKIYMNMLDMLFGRAQEMLFGIAQEKFGMFSDENDTPQTGLPSCFESTTYCEQHKLLLDCLGSLAFHTLHSCKREESLIFSESIVKKHMNSNAAVKTARTTGILSQHKSSSRIARCSHFSFLHKTFQEFLAAYYVATHVDESENTMQTLAKVYGQTVDIMDISELFTFVCGLSTEMSSKISESVMQSFSVKLTNHVEGLHIYGGYYEVACMTKSLQDMILAGYKESICNGHQDPQLALNHVFYSSGRNSSDDDVKYRDRLVDRNIDKIEALCAEHCTVNTVKIQQILTQSSSTLSHVGLQNIKGLNDAYLDLSTNISLKSLYLSDIKTDFDIKLNTSSLLYCHLWELNEKVEHNTLSALTAALQLRTLKAGYCKNMSIVCQVLHTLPLLHRLDVHVNCGIIPVSLCQTLSTLPQIRRLTLLADCEDRSLLCRTLPTLSNLQYIQLCHTDLGDNDILLPSSIKMIELDTLTLTGRSWRQLVDKLTQMPHQVKCILWHCSITVSHEEEKKKEWDNIVKYIQQYNMFEIRRNNIDDIGRISLHFSTCTSDKY